MATNSALREYEFSLGTAEISRPLDPVSDDSAGTRERDDAAERQITHFIPSVELKGSISEKLQTLDTLIVYLEQLRRRLGAHAQAPSAHFEGPSRQATAAAWPWFGAGAAVAAVVLLLFMMTARGCA